MTKLPKIFYVVIFVIVFVIFLFVYILVNASTSRKIFGSAESTQNIKWPQIECLPYQEIQDIIMLARKYILFEPNEKNTIYMNQQLKEINNKYNSNIKLYSVLALRGMEIGERSKRQGVKVMQQGPKLLEEYTSGKSIVSLAISFGILPIMIAKQLVTENPSLKNKSDISEIFAVEEIRNEKTRREAELFESDIKAFLDKQKIIVQTENDLKSQGKTLTPDFYFPTPIKINGIEVHWLEVKNYPAIDHELTIKSIRLQLEKYTNQFGYGAIAFNGGIMCNIENYGALVLDGNLVLDKASSIGA